MDRLHPGVYIQEIPSGLRPIEGVSTSTAGFIGKSQRGRLREAVLVTSFSEFQTAYGDFLSDSFLAHAVSQFFNNGGKKCYLVRVAGAAAAAAAISLLDRKGVASPTLTVRAANEGSWGNSLNLDVADSGTDADNLFTLQVSLDRSTLVPPQPALILETLADLSMDPAAKNFVETVVAAQSKYVVATVETTNLASALPGSSRSGKLPVGNGADSLLLGLANGGTEVVGGAGTSGTSTSAAAPSTNPPADKRKLVVNLDLDGPQEITIPPEPATGADIANAIAKAVHALTPIKNTTDPAAYIKFTCTFGATYVLTSGTTGATSSVAVTNSPATPIKLPAGPQKLNITINGDGPIEVTLTGPLADGFAIAGAIAAAVGLLTPKRAADKPAFVGFACAYQNAAGPGNPSFLLTSGTANAASSVHVGNAANQNVATLLKLGLTNGGVEVTGGAVLRPAVSNIPTQYHLGVAVKAGNVSGVVLGDDGDTPVPQDYKDGLTAFDTVRDVNILTIPGISTLDVVASGTNYCTQRGDCFFIGDMDLTDDTLEEARTFVNSLTVKSSYGAVYYPWLRMSDPTGASSSTIPVPPSGFVAGMYARIDSTRGVWKAPAGTEANIGGAVGLVVDTTDAQQDFLNPIGVNVIRSFPASGIVIWGSRTLATLSDPEYRYVPVRRTAIYLEQSIFNGIQYAVFEPNDFGLWASLRLNIGAFMMQQFRAGAFQGRTPTDAFFVKCDETTTIQADIDTGVVNILVGFAPLKPAEFVVLKLTQKVAQAAV